MAEREYPPGRYYDTPKAAAYAGRSMARHRAETALIRALLSRLEGPVQVLDVPCGTGRLAPTLTELGHRVFGADLSPAMLGHAGQGVCADAWRLPFRDRAFSLVVSNRFLHHLPPPALAPVLAELSRVAGEHLLVSFFHPISLHGLVRRFRCALGGRPSTRYPCWPGRIRALMEEQGFSLLGHRAQQPLLRELWYGLYRRR